jgi:AcrR family transcriptional regulator
VVAEAAAVADEVGWERLSLAAVAGRLGVRLPSLYKHIASLEALRTEVRVLGLQELGEAMTAAAVGRSGSDALVAVADAYRGYVLEHPGRYAATLAAPLGDHPAHVQAAAAVLRVVEAILDGYGLAADDTVDAVRSLRALLHGFVSLEAAGGFRMPVDVDRSFRRLVAGFDATLQSWAAAATAP